jgi:ribose transport system ATP-binding protein
MMTPYSVELNHIHKFFGGIAALQDVTLKAKGGEIHAVVGENGAGKSTLMKILAGAYQMDSGEILLNQKKVTISDPKSGRESGVGIIYQEFSLVPDLSVAENIYLHLLNQKKRWMPWTEIHSNADALIRSLGFEIPPRMKVRQLSTSQQQVVEIAKALSENLEILILDEPTAVLAPNETRKLFDVLEKLKDKGVTILYISHRLEEVFEIADAITILKDGRVTRSIPTSDITQDEVIGHMIGRKLEVLFPQKNARPGKIKMEVKNLCSANRVKHVSFSVKEGEVLGLAGLVGSGRSETVRALFGADKREKGEVFLDGKPQRIRSPRDAIAAGIGLVPEDRKTQGILLSLMVRENLTLTDLKGVSGKAGFIHKGKEIRKSNKLMQELNIKATSPEAKVNQLSGGNQQKVVLAKWLGRNCRVLLLDEPTRGIDVGAKSEIYRLICDLSEKGISIVMVSSEMVELMGICDRILVLHEGRINGEIDRPNFSEEHIMRLSIAKKVNI